ncbi:MAG: hypothetical protein JRI68_22470 [Deltaproteobacteria bacterium]|nr:hypothetical protein [Deltaproteobacteria bacterium]
MMGSGGTSSTVAAIALAAVTLVACGGEDTEAAGPTEPSSSTSGGGGPSGCPPGATPVDDGCREAGIQPNGCEAGEVELADGSCGLPGIAPADCAAGFVSDGEQGCEPVLPAEPCPTGQMAVPGEASCREVTSCGSGTWGDIPGDGDTEYVDPSYQGGGSDGSQSAPWTTIPAAVAAASPGAIVALAEGHYDGGFIISGKAVRLWGRCPQLVEVEGTSPSGAAIFVLGNADGTEIRSLALTGACTGVALSGSQDVILQHLWAHDLGCRALHADFQEGPTSVTLHDSLIENTRGYGVVAAGAAAALERIVIRGNQSYDPDETPSGLLVYSDASGAHAGGATLRGSVIEANHGVGATVIGTHLAVDGSVIRHQVVDSSTDMAVGIHASRHPDSGIQGELDIIGSVLSHNDHGGIAVTGGRASVELSVVRDSQPSGDGRFGVGVGGEDDIDAEEPSSIRVTRSKLAGNYQAGVSMDGGALIVEASVIRDTGYSDPVAAAAAVLASDYASGQSPTLTVTQCALEENGGTGVLAVGASVLVTGTAIRDTSAVNDLFGALGVGVEAHAGQQGPSVVEIRDSLIERATHFGVLGAGADMALVGTRVLDTRPNPDSGLWGRGVQGQPGISGEPVELTVAYSRFEHNREIGVVVVAGYGEVERSWIGQVVPNSEGLFGDGIAVAGDLYPAELVVTQSRVDGTSRAGIAVAGGSLELGQSELTCNPIQLAGDDYAGHPFSFSNLGDNRCGCDGTYVVCKSVSAQLQPPDPIDSAPPER